MHFPIQPDFGQMHLQMHQWEGWKRVSKQDPKSKLFEELATELGAAGFKLVKSRGAFEREREGVNDLFKLDFYTSTAGNRIQPAIIMRFASLDRLYHQVSGAKPADRKYHAAVSFAIWRVYGGPQKYEFLLSDESTVGTVAEKLSLTFREVALPFFDNHSTVADVDRLLNEMPNAPQTILYHTDGWTRCAYATIAAKLAANPRYDELVGVYDAYLTALDGGHNRNRYLMLLRVLNEAAQ